MSKVAHVIGNGPRATLYKPARGIKITCNLPPFEVENVYTTCMVDFKMMLSLAKGEIEVPGEWILGFRPKHFMQKHPAIYMKRAAQIKEFFTDKQKSFLFKNNSVDSLVKTFNKFKKTKKNQLDNIIKQNYTNSKKYSEKYHGIKLIKLLNEKE